MSGFTSKGAQSPAMQQYLREKAQYPDAVLFFRMGDFYELFFDDALVAAKALDLTLTSRNKNEADPIPMCGVPYHAAQGYIARMLDLGHNVALCEQLEDPAKAKGIVKRAVVRVFTPALVLEGDALDARSNQFLAAAVPPDGGPELPGAWALAAYDLTTGELFVTEIADGLGVTGELARLGVRELVVPMAVETSVRAQTRLLPGLFVRAVQGISTREASEVLAAALPAEELRASLEGVSLTGRAAAALALRYARATQPGLAIPVQRVSRLDPRDHLHLDDTTQGHLEMFRSVRGDKKGTLLAHLDRTVTPMGARRLRTWLAFPLVEVKRIRRRHDAVDALVTYPDLRGALREGLALLSDIERIAVRASLGAATPRDLGSLRDSLVRVPSLLAAMAAHPDAAEALGPLRSLDACPELGAVLSGSLADSPPAQLADGGVFRRGFDAELDRYVELATNGRELLLALEQRERERTKIGSLKVRFNGVFGYYIEVTKANLHLVPADYRRKQTVATGERFVTEELVQLETGILEAEERVKALESERFEQLRARVADAVGRLSRLANALADLDALAALAEVAHRHDYVRPVVDDGPELSFTEARHPVVEGMLEPGAFVPNDITLDQRGARLDAGHGAQHGRQEHPDAHGGPAGHHGPGGGLRARGDGPYRPRRPGVHPRGRERRRSPRGEHLHGGDARDGHHPAGRHDAVARALRRDRPRHEHLRRPRHRVGRGGVPARRREGPGDVCHALPRALRPRGVAAPRGQRQRVGARERRRHRLSAQARGGRRVAVVRRRRGAPRGPARAAAGPGPRPPQGAGAGRRPDATPGPTDGAV